MIKMRCAMHRGSYKMSGIGAQRVGTRGKAKKKGERIESAKSPLPPFVVAPRRSKRSSETREQHEEREREKEGDGKTVDITNR